MILYDESNIRQHAMMSSMFNEFLLNKNNDGIDYLRQKRKIKDQSIHDFQIGFCPETEKTNKFCRNLVKRIVFPIKNEFDETIAFSARLPFDKNDSRVGDSLVWWNEQFPKSFFLYGIENAWEKILEFRKVFIVEGPFDVISMHEAGVKNTVGVLSASLTKEHLLRLLRFTDSFILMLDGDEAGMSGIEKAKNMIEEIGCPVKSILLKINGISYDPDEFINKFGIKKLLDMIG